VEAVGGYAGLILVGRHAYVGLGGCLMFSCVLFVGMNPLWWVSLSGLLVDALLRSRIGLALAAIRDNEVASSSLGYGSGGSNCFSVSRRRR